MRLILGVISLCLSIWLMVNRKSQVADGDMSDAPLTKNEKLIAWISCICGPIISGTIFYYGWRKKLPKKASQANTISWLAVLIYFALSVALSGLLQHTHRAS